MSITIEKYLFYKIFQLSCHVKDGYILRSFNDEDGVLVGGKMLRNGLNVKLDPDSILDPTI